ncbi:LYR motif-containing protein 4B [Labeo rohita]|uniref:LYR motif-containing protein 4B n=1 Tax=Labeo rohita TaxID=84645 RepID=A0ABQ8LHZ4_LABRO|nr:LYR motif-containing protein 4B [Labeo rohita]
MFRGVEMTDHRTYALRRVRDAFRENRTVEDPKVVEELLNKARDSLALIQRQLQMHIYEHLLRSHLSAGMSSAPLMTADASLSHTLFP